MSDTAIYICKAQTLWHR